MSKSTIVEWNHIKTGLEGDRGLNFISTSHFADTDAMVLHLINDQLRYGYSLREINHNHPEGEPVPSDYMRDGKMRGDVTFAEQVQMAFNRNVKFHIYVADGGRYIPYGTSPYTK